MTRDLTAGFTCQVCGATRARVVRSEDPWKVVRCRGCGLLATWPLPSEHDLEQLHDDTEYYSARGMGAAADREAWRGRAEQVMNMVPEAAESVLDFGAGTGGLVSALRDLGYQADGVEPSAAGRALALDRYGVELIPALSAVGRGTYAAVVMLHVLEHLRDPIGELAAIRERLNPAGTLVIEVPHAGSVERLIPSRRREILDLPAHVHHFTPRTLGRALSRAGFEVSEVRLFNIGVVEKALELRRPVQEHPPPPQGPAVRSGERKGPHGARHVVHRAWNAGLAASRAVLPGTKFQLTAHPGSYPEP
jgi:SAM-dependent methyltransferase